MDRDWEGPAARIALAAFGAIAALSLWVLVDQWRLESIGARPFVAVFTFASVFFGVALALAGPNALRRAVPAGAALAVPITVLVFWASFRFEDATDYLDNVTGLMMAGLLVLFSTPFISVWLHDRDRWLSYADLFDTAWTIIVRYAAAWLFVGVFWLVAFLSNALLELVGIDLLERIFDIDWLRFTITGAVLGLALSVVYELRDYVSPQLLLRLMRLLVPLVLAVVAVFIAALPFRGLSDLFGDFSAAATLMGVSIGAITLVSTALDARDDAAISTRGMVLAARALSTLLPILTALALWSVVLRVQQYGWTPDRVLAALVGLVLVIYALGYAVPAVLGGGWMERVRKVNVVMALAVLVSASLWLTPLLNAQRIASQSQLDQFLSGRSDVDALPLWQLAQDWGRPGKAVLTELEALGDHPDAAVLAERIALAREANTRFHFDQSQLAEQAVEKTVQLAQVLPVMPRGRTLEPGFFDGAPPFRINQWLTGCEMGTEAQPGCVLVFADLLPGLPPGQQALLFYRQDGDRSEVHHIRNLGAGRFVTTQLYNVDGGTWPMLSADVSRQIIAGEFSVGPSGIQALRFGNMALVPNY